MTICSRFIVTVIALLSTGTAIAQEPVSEVEDPNDVLKIAALEALVAAPPERALPLASKVLDANNTTEVKSRALFVLSQIDEPEAQSKLVEVARGNNPELSVEAIRMIGIGGNEQAMAQLEDLYGSGDENVRGAVLEAYMIAGNEDAVFRIAQQAEDPEDFEMAVHMLGAMGAIDKLRALSQDNGYSAELVQAMGIVGGADVNATLMDIYRNAETDDVRQAALDGMLIAGHDEGVLELYRASDSVEEKRRLLETLSIMGSDLLFDVLDAALEGGL
jgi:HEAT repeat protein